MPPVSSPNPSPKMPMPQKMPTIPKSASRYILASLAVILFVTAMMLVIIQTTFKKPIFKTYSQGYADGFARARELSQQSAIAPAASSMTALAGTIASVSSNSITFNANVVTDESVDGVGTRRTAIISDETTIVLVERLSSDELAKKLKESEELPVPGVIPMPFKEREITITDLKQGQHVSVQSVDGENIGTLQSFNASKITVTE